jgi:hypothetical protein
MPRRRERSDRATSLGVALKLLVDGIASKVVDRVRRQMPEREQLRRIEKELARLSHRVGQGRATLAARRVGRPRADRRCKMRGCGLPHVAHGLCSKHYQAWRRKRLREATA